MRNKEIEATFFFVYIFPYLTSASCGLHAHARSAFQEKKKEPICWAFFFWFVECCDGGGGGGLFNIKEMVLEERLLPRLSAWTTMTATLLVASRTKSNSRTVE